MEEGAQEGKSAPGPQSRDVALVLGTQWGKYCLVEASPHTCG